MSKFLRALEGLGRVARRVHSPVVEVARVVAEEVAPASATARAVAGAARVVGAVGRMPEDLEPLADAARSARGAVASVVGRQPTACEAPYVQPEGAAARVHFGQDPETGRMAWLDERGNVLRYL